MGELSSEVVEATADGLMGGNSAVCGGATADLSEAPADARVHVSGAVGGCQDQHWRLALGIAVVNVTHAAQELCDHLVGAGAAAVIASRPADGLHLKVPRLVHKLSRLQSLFSPLTRWELLQTSAHIGQSTIRHC